MKRFVLAIGFLGIASLMWASTAHAQTAPVKVYLKSKKGSPTDAGIASESIQGIRLMGQSTTISPEDIEDVDYTTHIPVDKASIRVIYAAGVNEEKNAAKSVTTAKRDESLEKSISNFQEALKQMPENLYAARRHVEFKIAALNGLIGLGSENQAKRLLAVKQLNDFRKKHPDSWQVTPTMLLLVKLQAEQGNFEEVKNAVKELTQAKVPDRVKQEARMLVARLIMDAGKDLLEKKNQEEAAKKYAEAQQELSSLLAELPPDSPLKLHAVLAQAQCKAVNKDEKVKQEATKELEKLLKETTEKDLRAIVYNSLGELYMNEGRLQDARWQFLWVDVIYNNDKEQHAKSLYYLWRIFTALNEPERGQDFFETLTTDPRFQGTSFRLRAMKENQKGQ